MPPTTTRTPARPAPTTDLSRAIEDAAKGTAIGAATPPAADVSPEHADQPEPPAAMPLDATWKILDFPGVDLLPFDAVKFMHSASAKVWKNERSNKQGRKVTDMILRFRGTQFYTRAGMGVEGTVGQKDVRPYNSMPTYGGLTSPAFDSDDTATTEAYMNLRATLCTLAIGWIKERIAAGEKIKGGTSSASEQPAIPAADLGLTF